MDFLIGRSKRGEPPPTCREIAAHFRYKSPRAAVEHVKVLESMGFVRCRLRQARGIELTEKTLPPEPAMTVVPVLGTIPAGHSTDQEQNISGRIAVDTGIWGVSKTRGLFGVRVRGNSMTGRGIHEGDLAIADADIRPNEGDVVVALIDLESALKTLARKRGRFVLRANYPDLVPSSEMLIQGVVRAIVRRLY